MRRIGYSELVPVWLLAAAVALGSCGDLSPERDPGDPSSAHDVPSAESYDPQRKGEIKHVAMELAALPGVQEVAVEVIDGLMVYEGDIVLGRFDQGRVTQGVARDQASRLWPNGPQR